MRYRVWGRYISWMAVGYALLIILVIAWFQVRTPARHGDGSTPAPTATALLGGVLLFSLAAGAGSMAVIQLAKQILGVRGLYQEYKVRRWLAGRSDGKENSDGAGNSAYRDLSRGLGYGKGQEGTLGRSEERALFNLPIEQLAAQVSLAADMAISYPGEYPALLEALAGQHDATASAPGAGTGLRTAPSSATPGPSGKSAPNAADRAVAVSAVSERDIRLSYQVRSGVDALQLGQGWRRTVRLGAVLISGLLGVIWVGFLDIHPGLRIAYILSALILGGFISWFLRDLVAIVERLRS